MSVEKAIVKARSQLLLDQPFFGTLALRLRVVHDDTVETAATDGKHFYYNEKFISKLDPFQLRGLIAHEVMHCVFNHMTRRQQREHGRWNAACDYAINGYLLNNGFILPKGALHDPKYNDMTAEAIYNVLPASTKPCKWGLILDAGSGSGADNIQSISPAQLEAEWQISIGQAIQTAKSRGKLPGNMEVLVSDILSPRIDWRTVLWPFFTDLSHDNYSWRKPNRAYISEDEYLPSMLEEACGKIAVINDSSGSIDDSQGAQFISELDAVLEQVQPSQIVYIQADCAVRDVKLFERGDRIKDQQLTFNGRGGTAFAPAFKYLFEEHQDVQAVVYLTDLDSGDFNEAEKYVTCPVLWVSVEPRAVAPFGATVYMPPV
jgi:predicted metal-dependent peptidase